MAILSRATSWAHPRVCGENTPLMLNPAEIQGSSPRVRGKPLELKRRGVLLRLIPACAGKTLTRTHDIWLPPAHPRVCGENEETEAERSVFTGSSPRVRGKHGCPPEDVLFPGLIPACAGKTLSAVVTVGQRWAHPRVCGENPDVELPFIYMLGSSPRVRGKPVRVLHADGGRGLIPACAGKTLNDLEF